MVQLLVVVCGERACFMMVILIVKISSNRAVILIVKISSNRAVESKKEC